MRPGVSRLTSPTRLFGVLLLAACAACSTPNSRIRGKQQAFDAYPPEVQEKIRKGEIAVGYTFEQVELAMGRPDRRYTGQTPEGATETWVWTEGAGGTGVGLSVGTGYGYSTVFGGGVTVGSAAPIEDKARVTFRDGRVTTIQRRER